MGGFLNGVGQASTDLGTQMGATANANSVFNRGLNLSDASTSTGTAASNSGISGIDAAKQRFAQIMNGSPTAVATAVAPTLNTVNQQDDAQRRQQASQGTSRQGGVNPGDQQAEQQRMSTVANTTSQLAAEAPTQLAATGSEEARAGEDQIKDALTAMGLDANLSTNLINSSIQSRDLSLQANPLNGAITGVLDKGLSALGF
jgi:hypothetical protein